MFIIHPPHQVLTLCKPFYNESTPRLSRHSVEGRLVVIEVEGGGVVNCQHVTEVGWEECTIVSQSL